MRAYELVFIVQPELDEAALQGVIEKVKGWITEAGGTINKIDLWGKRRLAYPIRKRHEGHYVLLEMQMPPTYSAELERNLRYFEPVMRFLIVNRA
ncbi:30S ribosomal protein S6 [uncultured Thermanaerothrix sp.]|uniref:30S ribosomal protein S6 n=1 Tax=uncultured Thermanaerothrix sp. TaxID=1195149 RepID=UPI002630204C|nr:30S ribosomal protein S6 [uncultured Thermanaerothrix sp.]